MSMHGTIKAGISTEEFVRDIIGALNHMYPTTAIRMVSDDEIAIEAEDGQDWTLIIVPPTGDA